MFKQASDIYYFTIMRVRFKNEAASLSQHSDSLPITFLIGSIAKSVARERDKAVLEHLYGE